MIEGVSKTQSIAYGGEAAVSGARLRCGESPPGVETRVGIRFEPDLTPPIDISGRSVRRTDDGFGMQFNRVTAELLERVGDPF